MANKLSAAYYRTFINGVEYTIYMNNNKFLPAYWVENHDTMANYIESTWAEVKALKDTSKLEPGTFYLITDYVTTTTQTESRALEHYFDVLVFALANNQLSEQAWAVHSARDTEGYFADSKLEAWELKYCIDNDKSVAYWADTENGKGVIYYMKDEYNNECHYDFKNIQYKRYAITNIEYTGITQDKIDSYNYIFRYDNNDGKCFATRDIWGSFIPYNFNITNGAYNNEQAQIRWTVDDSISEWYYTFNGFHSSDEGGSWDYVYDISTHPLKVPKYDNPNAIGNMDECHDNIINGHYLEYDEDWDDEYYRGAFVLNNIVFIGGISYYYDDGGYYDYNLNYCHSNKFGVNCRCNTFGNGIGYNTFGNNIYRNTFGNYIDSNTFGNNIYYNTFGNSIWNNTFGNGIGYNTFGNNIYHNTFGNGIDSNTFGNYIDSNTFGNGIGYNTFGNNIYHNTFGNNIYRNTFGNNIYYNTFGNEVYGNTFGNYFRYNIVENDVSYLSFTDYYTTGNYAYMQHIHVLTGYKHNYNENKYVPSGIALQADYCQFIGYDNSRNFVVRNVLN